MLIPSKRHRAEDLELWAELEEADKAHAQSIGFSQKVKQSINAIQAFASHDCYVSVSWGKDSLALVHLVWSIDLALPCMFVRPFNHLRTPERDLVRDAFLARFDIVYGEVVVRYSKTAPEAENDKTFFDALRSCGERYISGISARESGGRKIRMRRHGLSSKNACAPLGWWSTEDVFAYLAHFDLPVHPAYAMLGGGRWEREHIRIDDLGGSRGDQFGRAEWEREYYGDVLNRLEARRGT